MALENRPQLVDSFINTIIDNLTLKDLQEMLYTLLENNFDDLSDEQLVEEVRDSYPELLV